MKPHEQRVVDEKTELDVRRMKLAAFIDTSEAWKKLHSIDQDLLHDQEQAMRQYSDLLRRRIARFETTVADGE